MGVTGVHKDLEGLTMTVTTDYDIDVARAWQLWADPRQLERWWGPPMYPATVEEHDLTASGTVAYYMTGPEGEIFRGWWQVLEVDPPQRLVVKDGFADDDGLPDFDLPTTVMEVRIEARAEGGVTMTIHSTFPSLQAFEELLEMGMEQGLMAAMEQIDGVLDA